MFSIVTETPLIISLSVYIQLNRFYLDEMKIFDKHPWLPKTPRRARPGRQGAPLAAPPILLFRRHISLEHMEIDTLVKLHDVHLLTTRV